MCMISPKVEWAHVLVTEVGRPQYLRLLLQLCVGGGGGVCVGFVVVVLVVTNRAPKMWKKWMWLVHWRVGEGSTVLLVYVVFVVVLVVTNRAPKMWKKWKWLVPQRVGEGSSLSIHVMYMFMIILICDERSPEYPNFKS